VPGTPAVIDTTAPPVPLVKTAVPSIIQQDDGTSVAAIAVTVGYTPVSPAGLTDLNTYVLQSTRFSLSTDASAPDWAFATQWSAASLDLTGTLDTPINQPGVVAATKYWLRAQAVDKLGNRSGWTAVPVTVTTLGDAQGPPQPAGIVTQPGMSVFGVCWDVIEVADLDYVEVQWRTTLSVGGWTVIRTNGTVVVITGVANETTYDVRVRSVDTSGNTKDAAGVSYKVADHPEDGWVSAGTVTPTTLPGSALVWSDAIIEDVFAENLDADWITTGTLSVGGTGDATDVAIKVYNSDGVLIGQWDVNGIQILDPNNENYRMVIDESRLAIYDATVSDTDPVVDIRPLGINAASVTFGSARGGHNLVQNSSFEMGQFGVTAVVPHLWTSSTDWNAANSRQGSDINVTTGATALTMTTVV